MARSLTTTAGGGTNRRFLLLAIFAALISAVLVFAALNQSKGESEQRAAVSTVPVTVASVDIASRTQITTDMVELRQVPLDARSDLAYTDLTQVVGKVTRFPISTNEQILSSKVVSLTGTDAETSESLSFVIPKQMRGISITVSEVISAGGLVLPGDYVDVIGVFDVAFSAGGDEETENAYLAKIILQNVEVLAVAQELVDAAPVALAEDPGGEEAATTTGQRERATEAEPNPKAATVTLAVTPEDAQLLFLAEANGTLRLTVRPFGEDETPDVPYTVETELIPDDLPPPRLP